MLFLLGKRRFAAAASAFFFHQTAWTFPSQLNVTITVVNDAAEWLNHYQKMMADLVATKASFKADEVYELMLRGSIVTAQDAKKRGLVDDVAEFSLPLGARWHQV